MENQNEGKAVSRQMPKSVITVIVSCGIFVFMLLALSVVTGTYLSIILQFIIWGSLLFFFAKGGRKSRLILSKKSTQKKQAYLHLRPRTMNKNRRHRTAEAD